MIMAALQFSHQILMKLSFVSLNVFIWDVPGDGSALKQRMYSAILIIASKSFDESLLQSLTLQVALARLTKERLWRLMWITTCILAFTGLMRTITKNLFNLLRLSEAHFTLPHVRLVQQQMKSGMKLIIWCIKLTILSCILSVGDWKQLTNRTSTSLPTSTQKMSISQLLFFLNIFVTWALFFFQANNICHLFFQYKWKKLAKKHEQLIQKGFEMFWRRNANLNSIFNHIAIKPCLSWFYFTTISMVTIWPNGIIPCSCTHIYWCFQESPPPPLQVTDPFICGYDWNVHDCLGISLLKSDIKPSV